MFDFNWAIFWSVVAAIVAANLILAAWVSAVDAINKRLKLK